MENTTGSVVVDETTYSKIICIERKMNIKKNTKITHT